MRKEKRTYYFSVEGETEKWYLDWLQKTINSDPNTKYMVKLDSKIQKDPISYAKRLTIVGKTEITHVFDYESNEQEHVQQFQATLTKMKEAQASGKNIRYSLGYSNFTFELWMILHMTDCTGTLSNRRQYLDPINRAYRKNFSTLAEYKHESNFKQLLDMLTLENVREAIRRSDAITCRNQELGFVLQRYKGFEYYRENPSLSIWKVIQRILNECQLV